MKAIVVYFSMEGHSQLIAKEIAKQLECDIFPLKLQKPYPQKGIGKYFFGGFAAIAGKKPALENIPDISSYDTLILGMPVWAGHPAPPMKTFMTQANPEGKKIALFTSSKSGKVAEAFAELKVTLSGNKLLGSISFKEKDIQHEGGLEQSISDWLGNIIMEQKEQEI